MSVSIENLVAGEQQDRVARGLQRVILASFETDCARLTAREVGHRFTICERIIVELRAELGWSVQRILDRLPSYLRCELDGKAWEPDRRRIWVPSDGHRSLGV